jgi:hypothetical protein
VTAVRLPERKQGGATYVQPPLVNKTETVATRGRYGFVDHRANVRQIGPTRAANSESSGSVAPKWASRLEAARLEAVGQVHFADLVERQLGKLLGDRLKAVALIVEI